jgi:hypothetical protein
MRGVLWTATFLALAIPLSAQWRPPEAAATLEAFEAEYPKTTVSGAALELEELTAKIGIDLVPKESDRSHEMKSFRELEPSVSAASRYLSKEISESSDRVGPPDAVTASFLAENAATVDAIRTLALGRREIAWDVDVKAGLNGPSVNYLGHVKVVRILGASALADAHRGETGTALQSAEAMWRLCQGLSSRPELMSHLIVVAEARFVVGLLRKIDSPAPEWLDRLRGEELYGAFLAALQNDPWPAANDPQYEEMVIVMTRIYRRFVDGLAFRSPCSWSVADLQKDLDVAVSGESAEYPILVGIASENFIDMVQRWQRFRVDSELTALVLEARGEKAASRTSEWPDHLSNLESSVCPGRSFSYRRAGAMVLTFEGSPPAGEPRGVVLPLSFRGAPPPTPTPTPTPPHPASP